MMACFSDSIQKAQTVSVCQFCEESSINWKCINCNLFLCQLCNSRIHSKITLSNKHHVINLEDCGSVDAVEASRKVDLDKLTCTIHSEQKCVLYCKNCERSVCSDCLIKDHKNHDFYKLDKVYDEKLKLIKDTRHKIESDIPHLREKEDDLQKILTEGNKQYTENRQKIIEIKDNIEKYADDLLSDLDRQWKPTENEINKELDSVRQKKEGLEKRKGQLDETLGSQSASEIFVTSNSLDKSMPDRTVRPVELKQRKFFSGKISNQPIRDLFGLVYDVPNFQVLETYEVKPYLICICKLIMCDGHGSAFIGSCPSKVLQKVTLRKGRMKCVREVEMVLYDITLMHNGDLLISQEQELIFYTKDGQIKKTIQLFAPLKTSAVHVNKQNELFLGLCDSNFIKPAKVVQINQKGDILHTFEYDSDNKRLFTMPHRICTNKRYIYVIDCSNDRPINKFIIMVLDKGGQLQTTYSGCSDAFLPGDIAVTTTDIVIVTDYFNNALHLLSPTGELIVCKKVIDLGIYQPYSLCIDKDDKIWIGTWNSKIHAIKLT